MSGEVTLMLRLHDLSCREYAVDFEEETALFERILSLQESTRILRIGGQTETGKTTLLHLLKEICEVRGHPCCQISLQLDAYPYPHYSLTKRILESFGLNFDLMPVQPYESISGTGIIFENTTAAHINVNTAVGVYVERQYVGLPPLDHPLLKKHLTEQFFHRMYEFLQRNRVVVVLVDAYENADDKVQRWLMEYLMGPVEGREDDFPLHEWETKPHLNFPNLVVVVAGQRTPIFEDEFSWHTVHPDVLYPKKLRPEHLQELVRRMKLSLSHDVIQRIYREYRGYPLATVMALQNIALVQEARDYER